jgi:lipoprotein-anchoring transpeptidase ErfK/SrfK
VVDKERLQDHPYLGKKWLGISYPDVGHAEEALRTKLIDNDEYREIIRANAARIIPPQNTALGGYIGIHGGHEKLTQAGINWTEGCIAMLDQDLEFVFKTVPVGTPVIITA